MGQREGGVSAAPMVSQPGEGRSLDLVVYSDHSPHPLATWTSQFRPRLVLAVLLMQV